MREDPMRTLERLGVIRKNGHYVYASTRHGSDYVNKDALYPHTVETAEFCGAIAERFYRAGIEAVVGPAMGGIILSQWTANHLYYMTFKEVAACFVEKTPDGRLALGRGYDKSVAGKRVLVVEDILTTGGSAKKTVDAVAAAGGQVLAVAAVCNRGRVTAAEVGAPLWSVVEMDLVSWEAAACPFCAAGVPVDTEFGHGKEFLATR
jgi:orotate phosphoribosyltransferase